MADRIVVKGRQAGYWLAYCQRCPWAVCQPTHRLAFADAEQHDCPSTAFRRIAEQWVAELRAL